jgi:hypothetical protein
VENCITVFKMPITLSENFLIEFLSFFVALQYLLYKLYLYRMYFMYNSCSLLRRYLQKVIDFWWNYTGITFSLLVFKNCSLKLLKSAQCLCHFD